MSCERNDAEKESQTTCARHKLNAFYLLQNLARNAERVKDDTSSTDSDYSSDYVSDSETFSDESSDYDDYEYESETESESESYDDDYYEDYVFLDDLDDVVFDLIDNHNYDGATVGVVQSGEGFFDSKNTL